MIDSQQQVIMTARRVNFEDFEGWIRNHLRPTDAVMLEATNNAWYLHDLPVGYPDMSKVDFRPTGDTLIVTDVNRSAPVELNIDFGKR